MRIQKAVLSWEDARKAMPLCWRRRSKAPNRPIAIAICDDQGELVAFARMDKCAPLPADDRKQEGLYGAGLGSDTKAFGER